MDPLIAPTLAAAGLLVVAGAPKVRDPSEPRRALRSVGARVPSPLVRLGALAEVGIGGLAILDGGRVADALVAACYLGFTGFVVLALVKGGVVSSCGCVGRPDTPPSKTHAALTALLAAASAGAAAGGRTGVLHLASTSIGDRLVTVGLAVVLGWLAWLALDALARLRAIAASASHR